MNARQRRKSKRHTVGAPFTLQGIEYIRKPSPSSLCKGCVADGRGMANVTLCCSLPACTGGANGGTPVIFVRK